MSYRASTGNPHPSIDLGKCSRAHQETMERSLEGAETHVTSPQGRCAVFEAETTVVETCRRSSQPSSNAAVRQD
jgi:hypothetical protein